MRPCVAAISVWRLSTLSTARRRRPLPSFISLMTREFASREPWTVVYADSEDTEGGNRTADKVFDLQESTYWQTAAGVPFPHAVVIDLGATHTLSGLQYLPRMESAAPASIGNFRIYVKETDFNF